jgi:hypothetical protein
LAAVLKPTQQRQQQQDEFSCAAMLAGELLALLRLCLTTLYRPVLKHAVPAAVMLGAARLAVAVLRLTTPEPSNSHHGSSSSSSVSSNSSSGGSIEPVSSINDSLPAATPAAAQAADGVIPSYFYTKHLQRTFTAAGSLHLTTAIIYLVSAALPNGFWCFAAKGSSGAQLLDAGSLEEWLSELGSLQPAALPDLGLALYIWSAFLVQQARQLVHRTTQAAAGSGSSKHQQQLQQRSAAVEAQVPAWHEQFLAAVGAQAVPEQFRKWKSLVELDPHKALCVTMDAMDKAFNCLHVGVSFCTFRGFDVPSWLTGRGGEQPASA